MAAGGAASARALKRDRKPPLGPLFWHVMIAAPICFAVCFAGVAQWRLHGTPQALKPGNLCAALAEGFLLAIFGLACLQGPLYARWRKLVEGDLGMAPWVHRCAGFAECLVLLLRSSVARHAFLGSKAISLAEARLCASAHIITSGLMGGAVYTWLFGVGIKRGLLPGVLVLSSSGWGTAQWLWVGMFEHERIIWHAGASFAGMVGAMSASALFDIRRCHDSVRSHAE